MWLFFFCCSAKITGFARTKTTFHIFQQRVSVYLRQKIINIKSLLLEGKEGKKYRLKFLKHTSLSWREKLIHNLDNELNRMASFLEIIFTCSTALPAFDVITRLKSADYPPRKQWGKLWSCICYMEQFGKKRKKEHDIWDHFIYWQ